MKRAISAAVLAMTLLLPSFSIAAPSRDAAQGSPMTYFLPYGDSLNPYVVEVQAHEWIVTDIIVDCTAGTGRLGLNPRSGPVSFVSSYVTNRILEFHFNTGMRIRNPDGILVGSLGVVDGECSAIWTGSEVQ